MTRPTDVQRLDDLPRISGAPYCVFEPLDPAPVRYRLRRFQEHDLYTTPCSNQKLHGLADHVPSMLASWDTDLRCRFANRAYKSWFGVDPHGLQGTSIQALLGPALFELNEPYMRRALDGEEQVFERLIVDPDGVGTHSLARYTPELVGSSVVGVFVEVTDVTRLKAAERALQHQIEDLERDRHGRAAASLGLSFARQRELVEELKGAAREEFTETGTRTPIDREGPIAISYPSFIDWCTHLGCTEIQLAEAIAAVGHSPARVAEYLGVRR